MEVNAHDATLALKKHSHQFRLVPALDPNYVIVDALRDSALTPTFYIYEDEGGFFYHAFHKSPIPKTDYYDIQSPYGYGGPLVISHNDHDFIHRAFQNYKAFCLKQGIIVEFIRFHPLLENWHYYQGEVLPNRETVWVNLTIDDLLQSYNVRARTAVRKALKSTVQIHYVKTEDFLSHFTKLYRDVMIQLNASDFYFFNGNYLQKLCSLDNAWLSLATYENSVVACAIFLHKYEVLEYHLSAANEAGKKLSATNLLLHETFEKAKQSGCLIVHLGGGTTAKPDDPLLFFKQGFSLNKAQYKIGKMIHQPDVYHDIKIKWQQETGQQPSRVLFYRDN